MFAVVMTFENETEQDLNDGITHVQDEVLPVVEQAGGVRGWWLVDRAARRRLSVVVWDSEEQFQAGMAAVHKARERDPDRNRPTPTSVQRFEIYGSVGGCSQASCLVCDTTDGSDTERESEWLNN